MQESNSWSAMKVTKPRASLSSKDSICIRTWRGGFTGTTWGVAMLLGASWATVTATQSGNARTQLFLSPKLLISCLSFAGQFSSFFFGYWFFVPPCPPPHWGWLVACWKFLAPEIQNVVLPGPLLLAGSATEAGHEQSSQLFHNLKHLEVLELCRGYLESCGRWQALPPLQVSNCLQYTTDLEVLTKHPQSGQGHSNGNLSSGP